MLWYLNAERVAMLEGVRQEGLMADRAEGRVRHRPTHGPWLGVWTPPPLDTPSALEQGRADATNVVRQNLVARAQKHLDRARKGHVIHGLQMTDPAANGSRTVPAGTWGGLPGLYSASWPTIIGGPGEASWEAAREAVGRAPFRLVELGARECLQVRRRMEAAKAPEHADPLSPGLDQSALAEEVAKHYPRAMNEANNAERS